MDFWQKTNVGLSIHFSFFSNRPAIFIIIISIFSKSYAKGYEKLGRVIAMMSYFGLREWNFHNQNIDQLATLLRLQQYHQRNSNKCTNSNVSFACEKINQSELAINNRNGFQIDSRHVYGKNSDCLNLQPHTYLEFDMRTIDWDEYFFHYLPGIKKYFFKERLTDNAKCIKHYRRYVLYSMSVHFRNIACIF